MNRTMRNARGRDVEVQHVTPSDLHGLADRIAARTQAIDGLDGAVLIGSLVTSTSDDLSDLDLRYFAADPPRASAAIEDTLDQMGAERDDDGHSIHFPLDQPARLVDGLYVEFTVSRLQDTEKTIEQVISGHAIDDGLIHSLRTASVLFDRSGRIATLQRYVRGLPYPDVYRTWITAVALDCDMKILRQAVARQDWHQAMTWLSRTCLSCAYVLFARNSTFFPGYKRLLSHTIPALEWKPKGFVAFWESALSRGVTDWESAIEQTQQFVTELKGHCQQQAVLADAGTPRR